MPTITYTLTDEAPALAHFSLIPLLTPVLRRFGIKLEERDISLATRILAAFPEWLPEAKRREDHLALLADKVLDPTCCLIKLPNISASQTQLKEAIQELKSQGYGIPDFCEHPQNAKEQEIQDRYRKILGSAVNPRLRDGNADRRIPEALKELMHSTPVEKRSDKLAPWSQSSRCQVMSMKAGDFYHTEQTYKIKASSRIRIAFEPQEQGPRQMLREGIEVGASDLVDGACMKVAALADFCSAARRRSIEEDLLFSLHLKATMMKVSDPVIFGVALQHYFAPLWEKYGAVFAQLGIEARFGLQDLVAKLSDHPAQEEILTQLDALVQSAPQLAMVDSERGITNFHVPSDIIIDASMATLIRDGGRMYNQKGQLAEALAVIPDSTYGAVYQSAIEHFKENGKIDPYTMGSLANVGLMAGKAQEYGSHPYTFVCPAAGTITVQDEETGEKLISHEVAAGDIWRMCHTQFSAIKNWVELALERTRLCPDAQAIFWLDPHRSHDAALKSIAQDILSQHPLAQPELPLSFSDPAKAMKSSLARLSEGKNVIAITGNVLRDYLTDLFPILEVGTSAKMLSIVSLRKGGGLFETGSGGSAPRHVQQFYRENHLRWDSLGEFLALKEAVEFLSRQESASNLDLLAQALDRASKRYLQENRCPSRKVGEVDTRGSHFYFMMFLVEALATISTGEDAQLWSALEGSMHREEPRIIEELLRVQGNALSQTDTGGYYHPDPEKISSCMQVSETLKGLWQKAFA